MIEYKFIHLEQNLHRRLKQVATGLDMTLRQAISTAVEAWVEEMEPAVLDLLAEQTVQREEEKRKRETAPKQLVSVPEVTPEQWELRYYYRRVADRMKLRRAAAQGVEEKEAVVEYGELCATEGEWKEEQARKAREKLEVLDTAMENG